MGKGEFVPDKMIYNITLQYEKYQVVKIQNTHNHPL